MYNDERLMRLRLSRVEKKLQIYLVSSFLAETRILYACYYNIGYTCQQTLVWVCILLSFSHPHRRPSVYIILYACEDEVVWCRSCSNLGVAVLSLLSKRIILFISYQERNNFYTSDEYLKWIIVYYVYNISVNFFTDKQNVEHIFLCETECVFVE